MDALRNSLVHRHLANRLCRSIYDIHRGELARLCLRCHALHIVHPSSISYSHATGHLPTHGPHPEFGEA